MCVIRFHTERFDIFKCINKHVLVVINLISSFPGGGGSIPGGNVPEGGGGDLDSLGRCVTVMTSVMTFAYDYIYLHYRRVCKQTRVHTYSHIQTL